MPTNKGRVGEFAAVLRTAYRLMRKHGLMDWRVEVVTLRQQRALGTCDDVRRTIYLDRTHVQRESRAEVRQTILHEIAHAREPDEWEAHGPRWQERALSIGVSEREVAQYITIDYRRVVMSLRVPTRQTEDRRY